eukprot:TRINITY_DN99118_c0_g1_i1.p1 TRINITY_DN99118_c0_g1~~TRINITY_DN99118_c0_g1_i1.p1  ORF type:complete len:360 (+),score=81.09 TRINITY_DN99118_c0_g1_i1:117-1196(+)
MAADAALAVVKQIHGLIDGPPTEEMKECLGQVVSSMLFFLDHPDSRVRLSAANALVKLSTGYAESLYKLDLSKARSSCERCQKAREEGLGDADSQELEKLLTQLLDREAQDRENSAVASSQGSSAKPGASLTEERGEVVLKVSEQADAKIRAAMLEKIVALSGVVSVTFEGLFVIVSTRSANVAADASFLADLLSAVKAQGIQGVSLVSAAAAGVGSCPPSPSKPGSSGYPMSGSSAVKLEEPDNSSAVPDGSDGYGEEAQYLDEEENDVSAHRASSSVGATGSGGYPGGQASSVLRPGGPQWTFFSQTTFMSGRRIQEFDDDPSIASRLAKAKRREEERKKEEKSKIGRLSSWLLGGR